MKNFISITLTICFFIVWHGNVKAQTSVNIESVNKKIKPKISLKFIDGIVITPGKITAGLATGDTEKNLPVPNEILPANNNELNIEYCSPLQFKYAMLMNREVESFTNLFLYNVIDGWWGTRYRYGGTNKYGIDCSAFTGEILSAVYGITMPRTAKEQYKLCEKIAKEKLVEGDLVFFNTRGGVSHTGVYLGDNYFVHSSVASGVTISSLTDNYYSRKFIGGGRMCR